MRTERGYDDCSVECENCGTGYPVIWKEILMIKVLVCRVGENPVVEECESAFKHTQSILDEGRYVQVVPLDDGTELYCDEDGMDVLDFNRAVPCTAQPLPEGMTMADVIGWHPDMAKPGERGEHRIFGNFLIARHDSEKDEYLSLTDDDIARWSFTLWVRP